MTLSAPNLLQLARDTLDIEAAALQGLKARLDDRFVRSPTAHREAETAKAHRG